MSTFRFRLETLHRLRMAERDERRADLAKALRAEEMLREQDARLASEQEELRAAVRTRSSPGEADVDGLVRTHRYHLILKSQREQLAGQIQQVAAEVQRRRQILVEADRQVRVLEKLRERQALKHRQEEERRDAKVFDETALLGYVRRAEAPA
jgi:flagellar FliJ protein